MSGSAAALSLAVAGAVLPTAAAESEELRFLVTSDQIEATETADNYTSWHQGSDPGGRYASTVEGLLVEGKTQIIKGEESLPAADALLRYARSSRITATGGAVWHQIGFGLPGGSYTTLRAMAGEEHGDWTTSQAINGFERGASAPLEELVQGLEGELTYLSGGFYVDTGQRARVVNYSVNGKTTWFALGPLAFGELVRERVLSAQIRPDESSYLGWHEGAEAGGTYRTTDAGLALEGKVQILNGQELSSLQVTQFVTGLHIVAEGEVWFQVPVMFGEDGFTTFRATPDMAAAGAWVTSRALPGIAPGTQSTIDEFALAIGPHRVIGYGFFVDAGKTATVTSIVSNGLESLFTSFAPDSTVPGAGRGQGADTTPPASTGSLVVTRGGTLTVTTPNGLFEAGETVALTLHPEAIALGTLVADATGAVTGDVALPKGLGAGSYRLLLQGASSYYWMPQSFVVEGTSSDSSGGTKTDGTVVTHDGGKRLAASGAEPTLMPAALAGVALFLGAGMLALSRRAGSRS